MRVPSFSKRLPVDTPPSFPVDVPATVGWPGGGEGWREGVACSTQLAGAPAAASVRVLHSGREVGSGAKLVGSSLRTASVSVEAPWAAGGEHNATVRTAGGESCLEAGSGARRAGSSRSVSVEGEARGGARRVNSSSRSASVSLEAPWAAFGQPDESLRAAVEESIRAAGLGKVLGGDQSAFPELRAEGGKTAACNEGGASGATSRSQMRGRAVPVPEPNELPGSSLLEEAVRAAQVRSLLHTADEGEAEIGGSGVAPLAPRRGWAEARATFEMRATAEEEAVRAAAEERSLLQAADDDEAEARGVASLAPRKGLPEARATHGMRAAPSSTSLVLEAPTTSLQSVASTNSLASVLEFSEAEEVDERRSHTGAASGGNPPVWRAALHSVLGGDNSEVRDPRAVDSTSCGLINHVMSCTCQIPYLVSLSPLRALFINTIARPLQVVEYARLAMEDAIAGTGSGGSSEELIGGVVELLTAFQVGTPKGGTLSSVEAL